VNHEDPLGIVLAIIVIGGVAVLLGRALGDPYHPPPVHVDQHPVFSPTLAW